MSCLMYCTCTYRTNGTLALPGTSVNRTGHGSSVPAQVVAVVQGVEVEEGGLRHSSDGALRHLGKHCVAQLVEEGSAQPCSSIWRRLKRRR